LLTGVAIIAKQEGQRHPLYCHSLRENALTLIKLIHQQLLAPALIPQINGPEHLGQTKLVTICNSINVPNPISCNMYLKIIEKL